MPKTDGNDRARAEELAERAQLAEERSERDGAVLRALAPVRAQLEQVGSRVEAMERDRAAQHAALAEQLRAKTPEAKELREARTGEIAPITEEIIDDGAGDL